MSGRVRSASGKKRKCNHMNSVVTYHILMYIHCATYFILLFPFQPRRIWARATKMYWAVEWLSTGLSSKFSCMDTALSSILFRIARLNLKANKTNYIWPMLPVCWHQWVMYSQGGKKVNIIFLHFVTPDTTRLRGQLFLVRYVIWLLDPWTWAAYLSQVLHNREYP